MIRSVVVSLTRAGATDALLAKHGSNGTASAIIQIPEVPALSPEHTKLLYDVLGTCTITNKIASEWRKRPQNIAT